MFAKNLTARILLLTLLLCANSVSAGPTNEPLSATAGVRTDYTDPNNLIAIVSNIYKQSTGSLDSQDKLTHTKTVIYAAANLDTGSVVEWTNPSNNTAGRVKVVRTKPVQGGVCRLLFTQVEKDSTIRDYSEYACKTMDSRFWTFYLARE
jgi:surface antigen